MNSNFDFLKAEWPKLFKSIRLAEQRVRTEPVSTGFYCRTVLEQTVHIIYEEHVLDWPYNATLSSLMKEEDFRQILPSGLYRGVDEYTRKIGNSAAHGQRVRSDEALVAIKYLYPYLKWFAENYSETAPDLPGAFQETYIPKVGEAARKQKEIETENNQLVQQLQAELDAARTEQKALEEQAKESELKHQRYLEQQAARRKATEAKIASRNKTPIPSEFTEAETRKHLIDIALKEAGWEELRAGRALEYPVQGMPKSNNNPKGNGFVDYVLWNDDGLPLALIEAKRTSVAPEAGRNQALLYANCLEAMHDQRPIIFYTNGYETYIWEDTFYAAPRRVYGFYNKKELQWKIQQRRDRKDIRQVTVNPDIAGRPYQMQAIQRVAESWVTDAKDGKGIRGAKRAALLVMATGSGKTRTAAALSEILLKNGWTKRILFLADRTSLVRQAKESFGDHLQETAAVNLSVEKDDGTARMVFSTYQTMIKRLDQSKGDQQLYGLGYFDLIIIDEAHRSVYNKFGTIFEYFDAMVLGLTATPKDGIHINTFELLGCPDRDPTFAYSLKEAVNAKPRYLNDYVHIPASTQFIRDGIKYQNLSPKEKEKYEETFSDEDTGTYPEEIQSSALNKYIFNKDTIFKVLDRLIGEGLKIQGGDQIGRTIIFAANQKHAEFILKCFQERYPAYDSDFIQVIHNKVSHADTTIKQFCNHHKELSPQIAISVDMMDTGIDAPRVLNLVFFKFVRSLAKFWQMIGRGTRLCPDVFGPGEEKKEFYIFDVCQNFEFFGEASNKKPDPKPVKPMAQQLFEAKLTLSKLLLEMEGEAHPRLAGALRDELHQAIDHLEENRFEVKMAKRYVDKYKQRDAWNNLVVSDIDEIRTQLSRLPKPAVVDERIRRFDLLMLKMQIGNLINKKQEQGYADRLLVIARALSKKYSIEAVLEKKVLIDAMKQSDYYKNLDQLALEKIKAEIRELMIYLKGVEVKPVYSNIEDAAIVEEYNAGVAYGNTTTGFSMEAYKDRVERFVRENKNHIAISKLRNNQPVTLDELHAFEQMLFDGAERGTKEAFSKIYADQSLGKFIRSTLGMEAHAVQSAFADFIQSNDLNADQMQFIQRIIDYLVKNGTLHRKLLMNDPFIDQHDQGIIGLFEPDKVIKVVYILKEINGNALS